MTKEEALRRVEGYLTDYFVTEDFNELEDIMKALRQESSEDCVSRKAIDQNIYDYAESNGLSYTNMKNYILDAPSATPTRKKGKWIGDKAYPICPKCNCNIIEEYISYSDYAEMYKPMKYCPNCGAKMESIEEE
jgi:NADH pyrophosphatase NudC (nudix superfamily)